MNLIDMSHKPGEGQCTPMPCVSSEYPYGLRLTLNEEQLVALGLTQLPTAGVTLRLEAVAVVTRSSTEDPDADGDIDYVCVELQLTELGVELEEIADDENAVEKRDKGAKRLYAKKGGGGE